MTRAPAVLLTANLFGIPFGLAGLAQVWSVAHDLASTPAWPGRVLWVVTALVYLVLLVAYLANVVRTGRARTEMSDQTFGPFTALIFILPMLLGLALAGSAPRAGTAIFLVCLVLVALYGGWLSGQWIIQDLPLEKWHPAYFLPTVAGPLLAAAGCAARGLDVLARLMLGYGLVCWVVLGSIILARLFTRSPLPTPLIPTLAIEVAPPVVAGSAWFAINDNRPDTVAYLISAEVVLANGSTVIASADGDAELWWALRGGGGNFGVVTSARFQLHPLGPVLGGIVMYPVEQAGSVLRGYREVIAAAPDDLTVLAGFFTGPQGAPVLFLAPTWSGDLTAGEAAAAPLTQLGTPLMTGLAPMPYPELLKMFEAGSVAGNRNALGTRWLKELTDDSISALTEAALTRTSPMSLLMLHQFHGAASRVAPDATAFALRRDHLLAEVIAVWPPQGAAAPHREWIENTSTALAPDAIPGGYPNILGPEDADRTRLGFGGNLDRLLAAKHRYDPDGIFTAIAAVAP